jgi:hypothetical protein
MAKNETVKKSRKKGIFVSPFIGGRSCGGHVVVNRVLKTQALFFSRRPWFLSLKVWCIF